MDDAQSGGASVFCTKCGYKLAPEDQFCPECGEVRPSAPSVPATPPAAAPPPPPPPPVSAVPPSYSPPPSSFTPVMPFGVTAPVPVDTSKPLLMFDVQYPERLSRLLIFVKWLLIIPHLFILMLLGFVLYATTIVAWFAILIVGRYPRGLWEFGMFVQRWGANVNAYTMFQRDEYPPFSGAEAYPVVFEMAYPERLSRWKIFLKWLLILPSIIVYYFVLIAVLFVQIIAWFAILFTGRFPRGMFDFTTGTMRWGYRITLYSMLFTDAYPPFTTAP